MDAKTLLSIFYFCDLGRLTHIGMRIAISDRPKREAGKNSITYILATNLVTCSLLQPSRTAVKMAGKEDSGSQMRYKISVYFSNFFRKQVSGLGMPSLTPPES